MFQSFAYWSILLLLLQFGGNRGASPPPFPPPPPPLFSPPAASKAKRARKGSLSPPLAANATKRGWGWFVATNARGKWAKNWVKKFILIAGATNFTNGQQFLAPDNITNLCLTLYHSYHFVLTLGKNNISRNKLTNVCNSPHLATQRSESANPPPLLSLFLCALKGVGGRKARRDFLQKGKGRRKTVPFQQMKHFPH